MTARFTLRELVWVTNVHKDALAFGKIRLVNATAGMPRTPEALAYLNHGTRHPERYAAAFDAGLRLAKQGMVGIYKYEGDEGFQIIYK